MNTTEYFYITKPLLEDISECGDLPFVKEYDSYIFTALIDVLGHGKEARSVAVLCNDFLEKNYRDDLKKIIYGMHNLLKGTRGAVISICRLDKITGNFLQVGIGNISVRTLGKNSQRLVSRDGIVGYGDIFPKENQIKLFPGDTVLLHSDGIKEHFDIFDCMDFINKDSSEICRNIMNKFRNENDDSCCITVKYNY